MGKTRVRLNPDPPARDMIRKHKNFDRFMDNYRKYYSTSGIRELLYRDRKKMAIIVLIVIFILLWLFSGEDAEAKSILELIKIP